MDCIFQPIGKQTAQIGDLKSGKRRSSDGNGKPDLLFLDEPFSALDEHIKRKMEREAKERERLAELYEDCDGRFAFIAGYTDGGAPYGVMWEEVGIDPGLPFEEKVKLYHMQM